MTFDNETTIAFFRLGVVYTNTITKKWECCSLMYNVLYCSVLYCTVLTSVSTWAMAMRRINVQAA